MSKHVRRKQTLSPLELIEARPYRRSHSENLMRTLTSSSYAHALLGNLAVGFAKGLDDGGNDLADFASHIREQERAFTLYDFIRCIEIQRNASGTLTLQAKRLRMESIAGSIVDNGKNHETVTTVDINADDAVLPVEVAQALAETMLTAHYRSQAIGTDKQKPADSVKWCWSEKALELSQQKSRSLSDLGMKVNREVIDYSQAVARLADSLVKREFHVLMTQNRVLLRDQATHLSICKEG